VALNHYNYELWSLRGEWTCPRNLYVDLAYSEVPDTLKRITDTVPPNQIVFGSATPFMTTEAALAKLRLGTTSAAARRRVLTATARFMPKSR
jgi:predicted TIM-barrel fold metal-dependent hydrolase